MAPIEFHRYTDARGDTIIYKFDPEIARNPDPAWPNDSAVSVFHHYILKKPCTINHHSDLLSLETAMERWRSDRQSSQPFIGMVMYKENSSMEDGFGAQVKTQYMWKGWNHGEGYRRGWAKLQIGSLDRSERVAVTPQDKGKERAILEPFLRIGVLATIKQKGRKDSKDLQDSGDLHVLGDFQAVSGLEHEEHGQVNPLNVLDEPLPEINLEVIVEARHQHDQPIDMHKQERDRAASKRDKRKHGKRGKGQKLVVDYRLASEHWPGLLHTPR